jgi:beta-lactamase regulating signal transducer with metallopeptidase domain
MIASWMLYVIAFTALYGAGAWVIERGNAIARRPRRGGWAVVLMFSAFTAGITLLEMRDDLEMPVAPERILLTLPGAVEPSLASGATASPSPVLAVEPTRELRHWVRPRVGVPVESPVAAFDRPLLIGWAALSMVMVVVLFASMLRMVRARRWWERADVDGTPVLVSDKVGPAVVGMFPGQIVLPRWMLDAPLTQRRLVIAHERAHLEARDSRALFFGTLALTLMPWNVAYWWIVRRQRLAVEADCDARVLAQHPDQRAYGDLLLDMSERAIAHTVPVTALAESRWMLEHRLEAIGSRSPSHAALRRNAYFAAGLMIVLVACAAPRPTPIGADSGPRFELASSNVPGPGQPPSVSINCLLGPSCWAFNRTFRGIYTSVPASVTSKKTSAIGYRWNGVRVPVTAGGLPVSRYWTTKSVAECGRSTPIEGGWKPWGATSGAASTGDFPGAHAAMRRAIGVPLPKAEMEREDALIKARLIEETRIAYPDVFNGRDRALHLVAFLFDPTGRLIDRITCMRPPVVEGEYMSPAPLIHAIFPQNDSRLSASGARAISVRAQEFAPGNRIDVIAVWGVVER